MTFYWYRRHIIFGIYTRPVTSYGKLNGGREETLHSAIIITASSSVGIWYRTVYELSKYYENDTLAD